MPLRLHARQAAALLHRILPARDRRPPLAAWSGPLVSVVVPCFNYGRFVAAAVDSVDAQTLGGSEVIVVDDGSTDAGTGRVLDGLRAAGRTVLRRPNGGPAAARNTGIAAARGKYICCLDADDLLHPTYLEKAVAALEADAGLGLAYAWDVAFGAPAPRWRPPPFDIDILPRHNLLNCSGVFRRDDWARVGGFRERPVIGYEDYEFWLRLAGAGVRGHRIPEPLLLRRLHGGNLSADTTQRDAELRALLRRHNPLFYRAWYRRLVRLAHRRRPTADPMRNLRPRPGRGAASGGTTLHYATSEDAAAPDFATGLESPGGVVVVLGALGSDAVDRLLAATPFVYCLGHLGFGDAARRDFTLNLVRVHGIERAVAASAIAAARPLPATIAARRPELAVDSGG